MLRHVKRVESELPRLKHRPGHGNEPQQKETKKSKQRVGIKIPDSYYRTTDEVPVFHDTFMQIRKRPHPSSSMTSRSVKSCPERSMGSMNSETAMTSESMNMKTDEDLLFGGSGAVGVETAKEMWCELIQNVKTDDDLIHGAGFQAMRLDSQEWQWPANQEWHIPPEQEWQFPPTNDQLIETDFSLL
jgi:hypothetical protein